MSEKSNLVVKACCQIRGKAQSRVSGSEGSLSVKTFGGNDVKMRERKKASNQNCETKLCEKL